MESFAVDIMTVYINSQTSIWPLSKHRIEGTFQGLGGQQQGFELYFQPGGTNTDPNDLYHILLRSSWVRVMILPFRDLPFQGFGSWSNHRLKVRGASGTDLKEKCVTRGTASKVKLGFRGRWSIILVYKPPYYTFGSLFRLLELVLGSLLFIQFIWLPTHQPVMWSMEVGQRKLNSSQPFWQCGLVHPASHMLDPKFVLEKLCGDLN